MKSENMKEKNEQDAVVIGLSHVLADTYTLYLKTQNFHWNVTGPSFQQLHSLFEAQYKEMAHAIDEIAERIRALRHRAPGSFKEFKELSSIKEGSNELTSVEMISSLIDGNEIISKKSHESSLIAKKYDDEVSSGLLISRIQAHEKATWILRSLKE
jgi:starvation-inducible DNA-binding protein